MRVAHIVNSLTKASGISTFCANISQHLAEQGVDVDLYVWWVGDDALLPKHERIRVFETKDTGFNPVDRPDIVHVHSLWVPLAHQGCGYARKNGIPYVLSTHGMLTPWALRHKWWKKVPAMLLYQYRDLRRASVLHATAESEAEAYRRFNLKQEIAVVPLGTDLPPKAPDLEGMNPGVYTALFLSRIHPVKGLRNLLNAWANIKRDGVRGHHPQLGSNPSKKWRLVIAGPDEAGHKGELLELAEQLALVVSDQSEGFCLNSLVNEECDADIIFTGSVYSKDKEELYRIADLFVLPSFSENFSAVVLDALAYGLPVITTKGTPWAELEGERAEVRGQGSEVGMSINGEMDIESNAPYTEQHPRLTATGRCGWWVDIGVDPLFTALQEATNMTDAERKLMGGRGKQLVSRQYTWPAVAGKMKTAYEKALSKK